MDKDKPISVLNALGFDLALSPASFRTRHISSLAKVLLMLPATAIICGRWINKVNLARYFKYCCNSFLKTNFIHLICHLERMREISSNTLTEISHFTPLHSK